MNSRQLQCAILLSEVRNFSQVAEKLNISQPALSKQILALEKDLGVRLFDRNTSPLTVTPAGEYFVRQARELIYKEDHLRKSMEQYCSGEQGRLVIGASPFRSLYLLPKIVQKVKERFPGVQIRLEEANNSDLLRRGSVEGRYDFAVVNLPVDETLLDVTPIEPDTLVLAVPNRLLPLLGTFPEGQLPAMDLALCKELPFVTVSPVQEMRKLLDKLCLRADFVPKISAEVVGVATAWEMAKAGVGVTLVPLQFVQNMNYDGQVTLFRLQGKVTTRQPVVVTQKNRYLSEYARYAIQLLVEGSI